MHKLIKVYSANFKWCTNVQQYQSLHKQSNWSVFIVSFLIQTNAYTSILSWQCNTEPRRVITLITLLDSVILWVRSILQLLMWYLDVHKPWLCWHCTASRMEGTAAKNQTCCCSPQSTTTSITRMEWRQYFITSFMDTLDSCIYTMSCMLLTRLISTKWSKNTFWPLTNGSIAVKKGIIALNFFTWNYLHQSYK